MTAPQSSAAIAAQISANVAALASENWDNHVGGIQGPYVEALLAALNTILSALNTSAWNQVDTADGAEPFSGDASVMTALAIGTSTKRALSSRFGDIFNLRDFGAVGDGATDDSAALTAAINAAVTSYTGNAPQILYCPPGIYRIVTPPPLMTAPVRLVGVGSLHTFFYIDPAFSGDLFSWSDCWLASEWPQNGPSLVSIAGNRAGPGAEGVTVIGTTTAAAQQNAFMFYDHNDLVYMRDVTCAYLNGRAYAFGLPKNDAASYTRESVFENLRAFTCGSLTAPVFEITSTGSGDSSNEMSFHALSIFNPFGVGAVIRNQNTHKAIGNLRFYTPRIEGAAPTQVGSVGDLFQFGDAGYAGAVADIEVFGLIGNASYAGYNVVAFYASSSSVQPFNISIEGIITTGFGGGVNVQAGRGLRFRLMDCATTQTNFTVGPAPLVGSNIELDMNGRETSLTFNIDSSVAAFITFPVHATPFGTGAFSLNAPNSLVSGGNPRGSGAVDLQVNRATANEVAASANSVIIGGSFNAANGLASVAGGGQSNITAGHYSMNTAGLRGTDRGRYANRYMAGNFTVNGQGQAQICEFPLVGLVTGAGAVTLTGDGNAPGALNVVNIPDHYAFSFSIQLIANDETTPGSNYSWTLHEGMLTRDAGVATTAVVLGAPVILSRGSVSGASVSVTADTTNGGLNISFTPPSGNTDQWGVSARVETSEVF